MMGSHNIGFHQIAESCCRLGRKIYTGSGEISRGCQAVLQGIFAFRNRSSTFP
jgi:hypothetical protein